MKTVTEKAYAKINLYLDVVGKRADGYHDIKSVMQAVSLCDTVKLTLTDRDIKMTCTDASLSCGEDNLCVKAARLFLSAASTSAGVFIELEKHIPMQAGLGGGSADAAAVLRGMNSLFDMPFGVPELCELGKKLGADVPFCICGGTVLAEGIGELLMPIAPMPKCSIIICEGSGKVSTPEAYRIIDNTPPLCAGDIDGFISALTAGDITEMSRFLYNRFEDTLPSCAEMKKLLSENGACGALMSGSGSAVYGIFRTAKEAESAFEKLKEKGLSAYLCETV